MAQRDEYGYNPGGEYAPAYEAALSRLRAGVARQRSDLAQAVASRGVRTSGVSFIPQETLERGAAEAEAGLIGDFSLRNAQDNIEDRRISQEQAFRLKYAGEMANLQDSLQRRLSGNQLKGQLIGAGIGAVGNYFRK